MTHFEQPDEPKSGAKLSFKVIRTGSSATWEMKFKDLPLENEAEMQFLAERGRKFAQQEYLRLIHEIPVMSFKK